MTTKSFIVSAAVLLSCIAQQSVNGKVDHNKAVALFKKCQEETNAEETEEDVLEKHIIPTSDAGKCLVECMLKEMEILKDGKLDYDATVKLIQRVHGDDPEKRDQDMKVLEECKDTDISGLDSCDAAYKYTTCIKDKKVDIIG